MEGNKVVSQSILNGVIFIGLYILFISGIPLLNMLALVAMPLPIVYITAVYGLKPGIVLSSSAGIMTALLSALLTGLFFLPLGFVAIGFTIGYYQFKKKSAVERLTVTIVVSFVLVAMGYVLLALIHDVSILKVTRESLMESQQLAQAFGLDVYDDAFIETSLEMLEQLMVFLMLIFATAYAFIMHGSSALLFNRVGLDYNKLPPFREWEFPKAVLIMYFLFWFLMIMPFESGSYMATVSDTGFYVTSILLVLQGLSFLLTYMHFKKTHKAVRIISMIMIVLILLTLPLFVFVVRLMGAFDMLFRFRDRFKV
ncbi:hypothetical protein JCM19046_718 [Bacillus sp. JCM 19046]|nr:hypothetical protein JCM19046_718 [Bacillus sp. JCM 19046]